MSVTAPMRGKTAVAPQPVPTRGADPRKDDALIAAFKRGDHTAFQALVLKYEQRVHNHCLRMVGDDAESYDLTQEVFLKVFRKIGNYEHSYAFYTWLYRITVNCCIDYIRRKRRHVQCMSLSTTGADAYGDSGREQEIPDTTFDPSTRLLNDELNGVLQAAINQLSEKLRVIIILKEVEGFSYEEIAEVLECSRGTVKSRLFRARERLKEMLAEYVER